MKLYTMIFVLLGICLVGRGQILAQNTTDNQQRLDVLQRQSEDLSRRLKDMEMQFTNQSKELDGKFEGQTGKLELRFDELALQQRNNYFSLLAGGVLAVLALLGGWIWLVRYVLKQSRKSLESKVETLVREKVPTAVDKGLKAAVTRELPRQVEKVLMENRDRFMGMLGQYDREEQVKSQMKLLLVAKREKEAEELKALLENWGFDGKNLTCMEFDKAFKEKDFDSFDLVLVDNLDEQMKVDDIAELVQRPGQSNLYLYHGFGHFNNLDPYAFRINFANTRFTLYARLMETLLFKMLFLNAQQPD